MIILEGGDPPCFRGRRGEWGGDSLLVRHPPLRIQAQSQQAGQQGMVMKLTEFFGLSIQWMAIFGLMYLRSVKSHE